LKSLFQTMRTGSLTVSLTPSLNPKMTLTKFLRRVTQRVSVFFIFYILSSHYFYILSSEPVQTDSTRSSWKPAFFFVDTIGKKKIPKKNPTHMWRAE
jgi:hypothetical protein